MPFVIENGSEPTKYRGWDAMGPTWVDDISKAIWYARRTDAESQHAEDDDAWFVREIDTLGDLVPKGPFKAEKLSTHASGRAEWATGKGWAVVYYDPFTHEAVFAIKMPNSPEPDAEWMARTCALSLNQAEPVRKALLANHTNMVNRMLAGLTEVSTQPPVHDPIDVIVSDMVEQIANNLTPTEVLHLYHEFVTANVLHWKIYAGVPAHPMWGLIAQVLDGKGPITEGPDWAFIQAKNRVSIATLRAASHD